MPSIDLPVIAKNMLFMWQNKWDGATLTAITQNALYPVTRTQHRWPTRAWRTTQVASQDAAYGNLGASYSIQALAYRFTNVQPGAVFSGNLNTSNSWGSPLYSAVFSAPNTKIGVILTPSVVVASWAAFGITDTTNPAGYLTVGRFYVGPVFQPAINPVDAWDEPIFDPSSGSFSEGHQASSVQRTRYGGRTFLYKGLSDADKETFDAMFADRGNWLDLWVCEDPTDPAGSTTYCRIAQTYVPKHVEGTELWELAFTIEELS